MAIQAYRRSFTPDGGTEFVYAPIAGGNGATYEWRRDTGEDSVDIRLPSGEIGGDGEYQANGTQGARIITAGGMVAYSSITEMQDRMDALWAAHPADVEGTLKRQTMSSQFGDAVVLRERYIRCRVNNRTSKSNNISFFTWDVQFRAASPVYLDGSLQAPIALTTPGSTPITAGGTEKCGLLLSLVISGAGLVTITPSATAGIESALNFSFNAPSAGTYLIDMRARTFTKSGVNMIGQMTGSGSGFFYIPTTTVNLVTSGPFGTGSTATVRRAWSSP